MSENPCWLLICFHPLPQYSGWWMFLIKPFINIFWYHFFTFGLRLNLFKLQLLAFIGLFCHPTLFWNKIFKIFRWIRIWTTAVWTIDHLNYWSFELLFIKLLIMTSFPVVQTTHYLLIWTIKYAVSNFYISWKNIGQTIITK